MKCLHKKINILYYNMPKNVDNYENERKEILQKILNILEITSTNKMVSLKKLDENLEKQQQIINLVPDIKKYFICSKWNYFRNKTRDFKRKYLSLIKTIMKEMNIKMCSTITTNNQENEKPETYYIIAI